MSEGLARGGHGKPGQGDARPKLHPEGEGRALLRRRAHALRCRPRHPGLRRRECGHAGRSAWFSESCTLGGRGSLLGDEAGIGPDRGCRLQASQGVVRRVWEPRVGSSRGAPRQDGRELAQDGRLGRRTGSVQRRFENSRKLADLGHDQRGDIVVEHRLCQAVEGRIGRRPRDVRAVAQDSGGLQHDGDAGRCFVGRLDGGLGGVVGQRRRRSQLVQTCH
mmetsp:Transcript_89850/g.242705  ORF Transcript_89850/g.242705 Transcript_89850/m.242705 type:complete len:220 (-) Transcript_89850:627-1286(-)